MDDWKPDPTILKELLAGLRATKNPDKKGIYADNVPTYSVNDIIEALESGSELGREHYRSYVDSRSRLERLKSDPKYAQPKGGSRVKKAIEYVSKYLAELFKN